MFRALLSGATLAILAAACGSRTTAEQPVTSNGEPTDPAEPPPDDDGGTDAAAEPPPPVDGSAMIVAEVQRELGLLTETHYQHQTQVIEDEGLFDVDCSGWGDYIIGKALPSRYVPFAASTTRPRPLAVDFVDFFSAPPVNSGWVAVATVAELVAGDIISWLEPKGAADTGHVMIVRDVPQLRLDSGFLVPIWDSAAVTHGPTDSRTPTKATGIGTGEIVLFVDDNGAPVAHEWYDGSSRVTQKTALARGQ